MHHVTCVHVRTNTTAIELDCELAASSSTLHITRTVTPTFIDLRCFTPSRHSAQRVLQRASELLSRGECLAKNSASYVVESAWADCCDTLIIRTRCAHFCVPQMLVV